jgi:hypothetical protein
MIRALTILCGAVVAPVWVMKVLADKVDNNQEKGR